MFKCAAVFSDHMVLQRGKALRVFGECTEFEGKAEAVLFRGSSKVSAAVQTIKADESHWEIVLPEVDSYMTGLKLEVRACDVSIVFKDVAIGEVYLAGGQSNMERELPDVLEGEELLDGGSSFADIRFYYTQKRAYFDEFFFKDEERTCWQLSGDEEMKHWSAVGLIFARKLARELGCTVGIIGCNWGGTSASSWLPREAMLEHDSTRIYVDDYENSPDRVGKSEAEQIDDYEDYLAYHTVWDRKCGALYIENPEITWDEVEAKLGKCRYPGPLNCASYRRPGGLHESMILRIAPYTLAGVIYYQGEDDVERAECYYDLMCSLIAQWRKDWKDEKLPFILTQLTMHIYRGDVDRKKWPVVREAQQMVADLVPYTGMAVIIDQGEFGDIHPKSKRRVGERLALQALWLVYGLYSAAGVSSPRMLRAVKARNRVRISFKNCGSLVVRKRLYDRSEAVEEIPAEGVCGFEIAGEDGVFCPAEVYMDGEAGMIYLESSKVPDPRRVRYLWSDYSNVVLYGTKPGYGLEDMPVAPFRAEL